MTHATRQIPTDIDLLLANTADGRAKNIFHTLSHDRVLRAIRDNEAEIERIRVDLKRREAETARLRQVSELLQKEAASEADNLPDGFGERQRQRKTSFAWAVRREVYVALKKAGHPMTGKQLYSALKDKEIPFPKDNPVKAITRVLWKAEEFSSVDGGYWLADEPSGSRNEAEIDE